MFTNGDKVHATKVLNRLGLQDCFEGIICFETLNPLPEPGQPKPLIVCKPALEAFDLALQLANADPSRSVHIKPKLILKTSFSKLIIVFNY